MHLKKLFLEKSPIFNDLSKAENKLQTISLLMLK